MNNNNQTVLLSQQCFRCVGRLVKDGELPDPKMILIKVRLAHLSEITHT